jgi:thiamine-monophosphate kinase
MNQPEAGASRTSEPVTVADLGERALIERIRMRVPAPPDWVAVGIGDDAAVLAPERNAFDVVTTDALVEGVHFDRAFVPPRAVGHRALAANLSDLAAMGARPRAAVLSLALPDALPVGDFDELVDGVLTLASIYGVALVGGNIARSPGPLLVDITALGSAQKRRFMRRAGARPGDVLYVSGQVGSAAVGLEWCRANGPKAARSVRAGDERAASGAETGLAVGPGPVEGQPGTADEVLWRRCAARFLYPDPRIRLGWVLARNRAASACVDLSDGLADAVHQLVAASGVGAIVEGDRVPFGPGVREWFEREGRDPLISALTGGDDYELLFTMPARHERLLQAVARQVARRGPQRGTRVGVPALPLTRIGVMTRQPRVVLRRDAREEALPQGFTHFR